MMVAAVVMAAVMTVMMLAGRESGARTHQNQKREEDQLLHDRKRSMIFLPSE